MKKAEDRLRALVEAGMALVSELDLDALLQRIADLARQVVDARYAAVGVVGEAGELTRFIYSGIDQATADRIGELPIGRGVLGVLVTEAKPLRLQEISDHPASYGFPPEHPPMHSFLGVPIIVRGRVFGRLYLTEKRDAREFSKDDERLALTLAAQAGIAIDNSRLLDEITSQQRDMAILEERERISKELHDGVIQSIYSVGLSLQGTLTMLERDPTSASERVDDVIKQLDELVRDVRGYIFELRPKIVEEKGLRAAISELAEDLQVNTLAHVTLDLHPDACDSLTDDQETHLIQIVREILSNIARHAGAKWVHIRCARDDGDGDAGLRLDVLDDGRPFEPNSVTPGHGLGNMAARAADLGGKLEMAPRSPKGMRHSLFIPGGE
jgi:signal transduction histidine kinase